MTVKFIANDSDLNDVELTYRRRGYKVINKFSPPNLAVITTRLYLVEIQEVPRQEISKFERFMDDNWK